MCFHKSLSRRRRMFDWDGGIVLRHSLAFAPTLHRRCVVNGETIRSVAIELGLDHEQAKGAVRLLKSVGIPSKRRLALVAMRDPGLDDADIAEMFGESEGWSFDVRFDEELKDEQPIPEHLEYLDDGLQPGDPSPEELARRTAEVRAAKAEPDRPAHRWDNLSSTKGFRYYNFTGLAAIPVCPGRWA
jgi:hypothetical protein